MDPPEVTAAHGAQQGSERRQRPGARAPAAEDPHIAAEHNTDTDIGPEAVRAGIVEQFAGAHS